MVSIGIWEEVIHLNAILYLLVISHRLFLFLMLLVVVVEQFFMFALCVILWRRKENVHMFETRIEYFGYIYHVQTLEPGNRLNQAVQIRIVVPRTLILLKLI